MGKARRIYALWIIGAALAFLCDPDVSQAKTLIWSASSGQVDGYKVYWSTRRNSLTNSRDVGNATYYDIDRLPLSEGVTYYLRVSAYNVIGESAPTAPVVFTPGDNTPPAPPGGLVAE